jgi:hypothetical protein
VNSEEGDLHAIHVMHSVYHLKNPQECDISKLRPSKKTSILILRTTRPNFKMEASKTKFTSIASKEMSGRTTEKEEKSYHKQATGEALKTVEKRSKEHDLKLYGGCFWYFPFLRNLSFLLM